MRPANRRTNRRASTAYAAMGTIVFFLFTHPAQATNQDIDDAFVCDLAAAQAARESGVPLDILRGITRVETGRGRNSTVQPWPWTVNIEGTGAWFDTPDQALNHVLERQTEGARSFDIGCFQINHRWHGHHFESISEMFNPLRNAQYAAQFLTELYQEFGSWSDAVGAYHSRTDRHAARYLRAFERHLADLGPLPEDFNTYAEDDLMAADIPPPSLSSVQSSAEDGLPERENTFPFIRQNVGASRSIGSLVPLSQTAFARPAGG